MAADAANELREFHRFFGEKLSESGATLSPEEALDEWRQLHLPQVSDEDVAATQEALADLANGDRGMAFDDFDRDFRKRHHLPDKR